MSQSNLMTIGAHAKDWSAADSIIGPLRAQRLFHPGTLPATFDESVDTDYPHDVVLYISYKTAGSTAGYVESIPSDRNVRLIYHHEPEDEYDGDGARFVAEFESEYEVVKAANPAIDLGMVAMTYQYADGRPGRSGSFLPPAHSVDFYGADNYQPTINPRGLAGDTAFQNWYELVKDRDRELVLTEYGVGATNLDPDPEQRAAVLWRDNRWLTDTGRFGGWLYWYANGVDYDWLFDDWESITAWRGIAAGHNVGAARH